MHQCPHVQSVACLGSYPYLCPYYILHCFPPHSAEGDLGGEGPVFPYPEPGRLLSSHPEEHHQTDLLLQSSGESLGEEV